MKKVMIFTFCGNREVHDEQAVFEELVSKIESVVYLSPTCPVCFQHNIFYCGGYGRFDALAARAVDVVRKRYPEAKTEKFFVTPYTTPDYLQRVAYIKDDYDSILSPPLESVPPKFAISQRNKWMVDECDMIFAYEHYSYGCTGKLLAYARKKKVPVIYVGKQSAI